MQQREKLGMEIMENVAMFGRDRKALFTFVTLAIGVLVEDYGESEENAGSIVAESLNQICPDIEKEDEIKKNKLLDLTNKLN